MKTKREGLDEAIDSCWAIEDQYGASGFLRGEERAAAWRAVFLNALDQAHVQSQELRELVRSPLEEIFLATFWSRQGWGGLSRRAIKDGLVVASVELDPHVWIVEPQAKVGPYFADFIISLEDKSIPGSVEMRLAVELDGHEFHEKTKRQAAHDKKRDRFFVSEGLSLMRFTGSEITRNPVACVDEAMRFVSERFWAAARARSERK